MDLNLVAGALDLALNDRDGIVARAFTQAQTFFKQAPDSAAKRASIDQAIAALTDAATLYDHVVAAQQEVQLALTNGTDLTVTTPVVITKGP